MTALGCLLNLPGLQLLWMTGMLLNLVLAKLPLYTASLKDNALDLDVGMGVGVDVGVDVGALVGAAVGTAVG